MKKLSLLILLLITLSSVTAELQMTYEVTLTLDSNHQPKLEHLQVTLREPLPVPIFENAPYLLELRHVSPSHTLTQPISLTQVPLQLTIPYDAEYEALSLKKDGVTYFTISLPQVICDANGVCGSYESPYSCPEDCAGEVQQLPNTSLNVLEEEPESHFSWMYILIAVLAILIVFFGYVEYKKIKAKHEGLTLNAIPLPSQPPSQFPPPLKPLQP